MAERLPPMVCVVGRKHVGKTTLVVDLCKALTRRGYRVMTLKHGSHTFSLDPAATDTYRHYHEGGAVRVAMASPDKFAVVDRWTEEQSPEAIVAQHLADADIVLCEGYKATALPKIEIHRTAAHPTPLWPVDAPLPHTWRVMVSDVPAADFPGITIDIRSPDYVEQVTDWIQHHLIQPCDR